ncbi:MAG: TolC family protein [Deltaproteobacteria bacterium]|nr:TolC family protein [Deltaproteobacteria bacterium]
MLTPRIRTAACATTLAALMAFTGSTSAQEHDVGSGAATPAAPAATPIGLQQAVEKAMAQNPQVLSGKISIEAAVLARKSARANFLPMLTGDLTFLYYNEKPGFGSIGLGDGGGGPDPCLAMDELDEIGFCQGLNTMFADMGSGFESEQYNLNLSLTIAQPITPIYHAYYGYKLADLGVDMATIEEQKIVADLKIAIVESYYGYLKAKAALKSIDEALVSVQAHVDQARAFHGAELITKNDLLQAETRLAQLKGTRLSVAQGVILAREGLLLLLNEPPGTMLEPVDDTAAEEMYIKTKGIPTEEEAFKLAEKNRPELKQMRVALEQADAAVMLAKGGYIPSVAAFGSFQHQEGSVMDQPQFVLGASLSWNIFQWGKVYYSVDEAKARAAAAEAGMESLERAIQFEVTRALLGIDLASNQIEVQQEAVGAAEEQLRIEKQRYDKQVSTTTEVLDATTRLVEAQVTLSTYRYEYRVSIAKLWKACGTL